MESKTFESLVINESSDIEKAYRKRISDSTPSDIEKALFGNFNLPPLRDFEKYLKNTMYIKGCSDKDFLRFYHELLPSFPMSREVTSLYAKRAIMESENILSVSEVSDIIRTKHL